VGWLPREAVRRKRPHAETDEILVLPSLGIHMKSPLRQSRGGRGGGRTQRAPSPDKSCFQEKSSTDMLLFMVPKAQIPFF
jgi:hypothetical protein